MWVTVEQRQIVIVPEPAALLIVRIRCAVEALPYENPRVSAIAISNMLNRFLLHR